MINTDIEIFNLWSAARYSSVLPYDVNEEGLDLIDPAVLPELIDVFWSDFRVGNTTSKIVIIDGTPRTIPYPDEVKLNNGFPECLKLLSRLNTLNHSLSLLDRRTRSIRAHLKTYPNYNIGSSLLFHQSFISKLRRTHERANPERAHLRPITSSS